jgi:hypothetical protein
MPESNSAPRYSLWQAMGAAVNLSIRAIEEVRALSRLPGPQGERGPKGDPGQLDIAKAWTDGVHYKGQVVTHNGSTYQALDDTGKAPPSDDWVCLAERGRGFRVRGTHDPEASYQSFDIVMRGSSSFVALRDSPGMCPGEGWQLWAGSGRRGDKGERGERGERGQKGDPGPGVVRGAFTADDMKLILTQSDGSKVEIDMYELALALRDSR